MVFIAARQGDFVTINGSALIISATTGKKNCRAVDCLGDFVHADNIAGYLRGASKNCLF